MESNTEYVGFLVSEEVDKCLQLLCAIQDTSKGAILRDILTIYLEHKGWDSDALINELAQQLYTRWSTVYVDKKELSDYLSGAVEYLVTRHKLSELLIEKVMTRCEQLQKED